MNFSRATDYGVSMKKNNNTVELHSTASHGPTYFYQVVRAAIWLLKQNNKIDVVEIHFNPIRVISPLAYLRSINAKNVASIYKRIRSIASRSISADLINSKHEIDDKNKVPNLSGLYEQIFEIGEPNIIKTSYGDLSIFPAKNILTLSFRDMLSNDWVAIRLWLRLYVAGKKNNQRLLNLTYHGVLIGDLIASTALREYPEAGGSLDKSKGDLSLIARSVALVDYCRNQFFTSYSNEVYITIPEQTYLHGIYKRVLHSAGAKIIDKNYTGHYKIIPPKEAYTNPGMIQNSECIKMTGEHRGKAVTYLNGRIEKPLEYLWYMFNGVNRTDKALFDLSGVEVKIQKNQLYVVVFLHSFDDAQYAYGLDGFDDLYHWTTETIDSLLANRNVNTIFVKPHPNSDYSSYPGDKVAFERLVKRYKQRKRVVWLGKDISPKSFVDAGKFVGITHHGSIAEELTFLGIPVVAGVYAPWGRACKFVHAWSSPNEYREILMSLSVENWRRPSELMRDELYRFVLEYRIDIQSICDRSAWIVFANLIDDGMPEIGLENHKHYGEMLRSLSCDSAIFRDFIEQL
jgi:hypothetical protein